jgi:hypothetical protein
MCVSMRVLWLDSVVWYIAAYPLRWWRNWARPSRRGPWLFCRDRGLGLHRWVAWLKEFIISACNSAFCDEGLKLTTINILLVGEDEENNVAHFAILDDTAKFGFGFFHAGPVAGVDHEDESVGACWVVLLACGSES